MLERMRDAMHDIDRNTVRQWVTQLVLEQTYVGLPRDSSSGDESRRVFPKTLAAS